LFLHKREATSVNVSLAHQFHFIILAVPNGKNGGTGLSCSFEKFGTSLGTFVNDTTVLCMSPHFSGTPDDYYMEQVPVAVAMNGQDFDEIESQATVMFVGTGSNNAIWHFLIGALLISLLILAIAVVFLAYQDYLASKSNSGKGLLP
jgi:hypothetical protein